MDQEFLGKLLIASPGLEDIRFRNAVILICEHSKEATMGLILNKPLYNFLVNKWYFDELYNILFIQSSKKIGLFFWKIIDVKTIDKFGPDGISSFIKILSLKASKFQSGFIYQYAFMILIGFSAILTFLILNS